MITSLATPLPANTPAIEARARTLGGQRPWPVHQVCDQAEPRSDGDAATVRMHRARRTAQAHG
jgi:hypothetical protein